MKKVILPFFIALIFMSSCKKEFTSSSPAITSQAKVKPCIAVPTGVGLAISLPIYKPDNLAVVSISGNYYYYVSPEELPNASDKITLEVSWEKNPEDQNSKIESRSFQFIVNSTESPDDLGTVTKDNIELPTDRPITISLRAESKSCGDTKFSGIYNVPAQ